MFSLGLSGGSWPTDYSEVTITAESKPHSDFRQSACPKNEGFRYTRADELSAQLTGAGPTLCATTVQKLSFSGLGP